MKGKCEKCTEPCLDCQCGTHIKEDHCTDAARYTLGCEPPGSIIRVTSETPLEFLTIPEEKVNHPSHYQGQTIEVIDVIEDFNLGFSLGNAIKYILRAGKKGNKAEDLKKAKWYLEREIANEET